MLSKIVFEKIDQYTAYGHGTTSAFSYTHAEDEASFSVVDNRSGSQKKSTSYRTSGGTKVCTKRELVFFFLSRTGNSLVNVSN